MFNPSMHELEEASNGFQQLSFNIPILLHLGSPIGFGRIHIGPMCQVVMTKPRNIFTSNSYVNQCILNCRVYPVSGSVAQW